MQFSLKKLIWISIFAALLGCLADNLLLYQPQARYESMDYQFLLHIPLSRLCWGHYLGIVAIPFELLGLMVFAARFRPLGQRTPYIVGAVLVLVLIIGVAYHAAIVFVADSLQHAAQPLLEIERLRPYFDPLGSVLAVVFLSLSFVLAFLTYKKRINLPRWTIAANPACSYLFCVMLYLLVPDIGRFFLVAGFNFSITILLIALLYVVDN